MGVLVEFQGAQLRFAEGAVRFPLELAPPPQFDPVRPSTWPRVDGRLEFVDGRLLFMPPCGDDQQEVAVDVVFVLRSWARRRPAFVVGGNEAGMLLGGDARAAEAAVWRRADLGPNTGGFRRVAPLLAVEVAGRGETEAHLVHKSSWYLRHGVRAVWLVFPESREVVVATSEALLRLRGTSRLPAVRGLPGLAPRASDCCGQVGLRRAAGRRTDLL
jgi:Uma2 family endonuclease